MKTLLHLPMSAITMHLRAGVSTAPLRVDLAGGWLDLPKFARPGAFIVNCAIKPLVSLENWHYQPRSGLGGSATHALLSGKNPLSSELGAGVGWQDPAIILETGLCVWRSGPSPVLHAKLNPDGLMGLMALFWTGQHHDTAGLVRRPRDFDRIKAAGEKAAKAALSFSVRGLQRAIQLSCQVQIAEGMSPLPKVRGAAAKYCGSGWGGYALYLFNDPSLRDHFLEEPGTIAIEPFLRDWPA